MNLSKRLLLLSSCLFSCEAVAQSIFCPDSAAPLERYAAHELQRYLHAATGITPEIRALAPADGTPCFILARREAQQDPQSYSLKRNGATLTIAGGSPEGVLHGVYGLLTDHYGIGFHLGGDVLPETKSPLMPATLDETKTSSVAIRGYVPWTNFPQSDTSYSWEDWKFIIDQTAKMRMNFIMVHNYNGEGGHNEPFHDFEWKGKWSKTFMPTAKTGHGWFEPGWEVNRYRFGAADLFDDYDFGSDCALHNESLDNRQVFRKGVTLLQKVIAYAHTRGVRIGLGLDINLVAGMGWQWHGKTDAPAPVADPADPAVVTARAKQVAEDYPDLDYLVCFQSEGAAHDANQLKKWQGIFDGIYKEMKQRSPLTRLAVSGWGVKPWTMAQCPPDVICAPIAPYSASFDNGAGFGDREYWGCPWLEQDGRSSMYYYPYNMHLSDSITGWKNRAPNMKGLYCLTWRVTDAIDPKIGYIAAAPWDSAGKLDSSRAVYRAFAAANYGEACADAITDIINQNEPFATDFAECLPTPFFTMEGRNGRDARNMSVGGMDQHAKAVEQIATIDRAIAAASPMQAERLKALRCRIAAARDHIALNHRFNDGKPEEIAELMQSWVHNFTHRVTDISSLGNVVSIQNRFVQQNYLPKESTLAPVTMDAPLHPVVISPPTSVAAGQTTSVKVRVLNARDHSQVSATLHWRTAGTTIWTNAPMTRRAKAIFSGTMPAVGLVEYHIGIAEGARSARFPSSGELTFVTTGTAPTSVLPPPGNFRADGRSLAWDAVPGAFWYRIYRDGRFLTYVAADTLSFEDAAPDFDGKPLSGTHAYTLTAQDKHDNESSPAKPVPKQGESGGN